jgi:Uma2 family endonuclease
LICKLWYCPDLTSNGPTTVTSLWKYSCSILTVSLMSSQITRKRFTIDDCYKMAEVGILSPDERTELINGEILIMPPPGPRHGFVVDSVNEKLVNQLRGKGIVRVQGGVVLHKFAAPMPDIVLLRPRGKAYLEKNPDASDIFIIIEVADSSLELDTTVKLQLYAILSVPEYWIADLRNNQLLVYSNPVGDSYQSMRKLHRGDTVAPSLLPDCVIPVDLLLP